MERACHFEIPYGDKNRVEDFYPKVFGREISDAPAEHP